MEKLPDLYKVWIADSLKDYILKAQENNLNIHGMPPHLFITDMSGHGFSFQEDFLLLDDIPLDDWRAVAEDARLNLSGVGYVILCVVGENDLDTDQDHLCLTMNLGSLVEHYMCPMDLSALEKIENPYFMPAYGEAESH